MESVPSAFIITVIWILAGEKINTIFGNKLISFVTGPFGDKSLFNIIFNRESPSLFTRIFGLSPSEEVAVAEFFTTYAISIISAALGLAKCLKNGVARPIAPGGESPRNYLRKFSCCWS